MYQALGGMPVQWTREMTETWLRYAGDERRAADRAVRRDHRARSAAARDPLVRDDEQRREVGDAHAPRPLVGAGGRVDAAAQPHRRSTTRRSSTRRRSRADDMPVPTLHRAAGDRPEQRAQHAAAGRRDPHACSTQYGIDPARPLLCHVSPCDAASDLCGVVDVWQKARERAPGSAARLRADDGAAGSARPRLLRRAGAPRAATSRRRSSSPPATRSATSS